LRDGQDAALDDEGTEYSSVEALRQGMMSGARDTMTADLVRGHLDLTLRIDAEASDGTVVESLPFAEAVQIPYPEREPAPGGG
jgi:O-succinylbenzoate synthase